MRFLLIIWQTCGRCRSESEVYRVHVTHDQWPLTSLWNPWQIITITHYNNNHSLSSKANLDKRPNFPDVLLPVLGEESCKLAFLNHAMWIVCLRELWHLKALHDFYFNQWMETLRAQAFSTGPSCTSWSSASPIFTFEKILRTLLLFWKVMGEHYFTQQTQLHVQTNTLLRITVIIKSS